jgi:mono/diheme cytochrome c family protein
MVSLLFVLSCLPLANVIAEQESGEKSLREYYDLQEGWRLYEQYCRLCHGEQGKGKAYKVTPPPADLTSSAVQKKSDAELMQIIHGGGHGTSMGAWSWVLSEKERQNILLYIRRLAR